MKVLVFLTYVVVATLGMWFLEGFVITKYWAWFVTPTFEIKTPPLWICVGLSMLATLLTNHSWDKTFKDQMENDDNSEESMKKGIVLTCVGFFRIIVFLFCGWIVHCIAG